VELRLFLNTPIIIILKRFCFLLREDWKIFSSPSEMYLRFFFSFSQCAATAAAIAKVKKFYETSFPRDELADSRSNYEVELECKMLK
jgi:hypothetical protein